MATPVPPTTTTTTTTLNNNSNIKHIKVKVNGVEIHVAEAGPQEGPTILFIHGFPSLWYTWRHQLQALSSLGYRTLAPDMRGYGETHAPKEASKYTYQHIVGDLVGLLDELGVVGKVFVVGHDWGAVVAWWFCLFRGDLVKALVNTSVVFNGRSDKGSMIEMLSALYGQDYYMCRFQVPGEMESEVDESGGADALLRKCFTYCTPGPLFLPKGQAFDDLPPYPSWLTQEDTAYYRDTFTRTGFTGGFNYYRSIHLNWELTAPWAGAQVKVPVKFIVGDLDLTYHMHGVKDYINSGGMKKVVPLLQEVVILEGVGHFLQEETPDVISNHIYDFIKKF